MQTTQPHEPDPVPAPPPFFFTTDLEDDEVHVEVDADNQGDDIDPVNDNTVCETIEFMGEGYVSLSAYFISQLEEFVDEPAIWILTCLDMAAVQRRFEGNGRYRYVFESGAVYRQGLPNKGKPKKDPEPDAPGPFMPSRGS